jgi:NAD(P)-dependent dehydrogenase (short-subunit alcohol dehydrogenase family)
MPNRFDGQVALITGASSGVGAALAREFARQGAHTVLMARRAERVQQLAAELSDAGERSLAIAGDVTRDGDVERAVDLARKEFGRLNIAVANAGILVTGQLADLTLDDYRRQLETNVFGVLRTVFAVLPALRETRGRLVIIGSLLGMISTPRCTPYCMSKFALVGLSGGLSHELAPYGISLTQVTLGSVDTEIYGGRYTPAKSITVSAPAAARRIVSAVYRRKRSEILPAPARIAVFLQRHFPALVDFGLSRQSKTV